jgi:two-component system nitrate/nitrite response regulator NarL
VRSRVRVVVADPHPVFLEGLTRGIREDRPDLEVVDTASDGRETLREIRGLRPDVALIEYDLPSFSGMQVLTALVREASPTRVVFVSARTDSETVYAAIAGGAAGWLTKAAYSHEIADAALAAHRGQTVLSPAVQPGIVDQIATRAGDAPPTVTPRERDVLTLIASGSTVNRVAERLGVSRATVKTHLQHLYEKLGVSSQAAAVAEAMRRELMD